MWLEILESLKTVCQTVMAAIFSINFCCITAETVEGHAQRLYSKMKKDIGW